MLQNPTVVSFAVCIVNLAMSGDPEATDIVFQNPDSMQFAYGIASMAKSGDKKALKFIFQQIIDSQNYIDFFLWDEKAEKYKTADVERYLWSPMIGTFLDFLAHQALQQDSRVKEFISKNVRSPIIIEHILRRVYQADAFLKELAFNNCNTCSERIIEWAESGDVESKNKILALAGRLIFNKTVIRWAESGDVEARQAIFRNQKCVAYQNYISSQAIKGDRGAITALFNNYRSRHYRKALFTLADAGDLIAKEKVYASYKDYSVAKHIIGWAEAGDLKAKDFVCNHTEEYVYKIQVKEWSEKKREVTGNRNTTSRKRLVNR